MRHLHSGRKLGVTADHRRALLRSLTLALLERETIKTTTARAKELRWYADHVVTLAKQGDVAGRRQIVRILGSTQNTRQGSNRVRLAIGRLYASIVPRFHDRHGGYTQIYKLAHGRAGDNSDMCIMRYIPTPEREKEAAKKPKGEGKDKKTAADKNTEKKAAKAAAKDTAQKEATAASGKPEKTKSKKEV